MKRYVLIIGAILLGFAVKAQSVTYTCRYWFDQSHTQAVTTTFSDSIWQTEIDVGSLTDGLHTLHIHVMDTSMKWSAPQDYLFLKMSMEDPNIEQQYICWFDDDYSTMQMGLLGNGSFLLDVDALSSGLHTVNIQVNKGSSSSPKSYFFFKTEGVEKWEYCINGNWENRITTEVEITDTLDIVGLLPVETQPIRSTCFQFHPNGDVPEIFAKNEITFRFWDSGKYFKDQSKLYVDENVVEVIQADTLERNSTETMPAPRNNQITWFKLDAGIGDSLSFVANKACTMQLFAPSGEEVYNVLGPESVTLGGLHAWEDGTYYLAVHDVMGSGDQISVTYQYLHKYAVLAYDVHLVGNGGRSTITFQGNGFNSLLDVYLVNTQNDTIRPMNIGHESNTTTTVTFDFNGVELGYYKAMFHFTDEDLTKENCIQVEEATPFVFDATVSFASQFLRTTSNKYVFQVRNNSNMTAYNVPLAIHIYTPNAESLTRVDIDGFDVKSYISEIFGSYYSDSLDNVIEQKRQTSGDLFGFLEDSLTEFVPAFPYLHYIFITPTLRPNTTETITIAVKSTNTVYVYMWYPEEWENEDPTENLSRTRSANDKSRGYVSRHDWMCAQNELLANANEPLRYPNIICDGDHDPDRGGMGGPSTPVNSLDPNDIHGYLSESGSHFMRQEIQNVQYEIEFENDTTLATAAAHTIIVRDTLNRSRFDLNSLAARSVTIGSKRLDLNGEQTFARTLDLRPELYVIAQINQDYNPTTGIIQWTIQSLDPMTMEPTDDPNQGVLPVNYYGNGVGFIDYSINLLQAFEDGTEIGNRAGIIFDQNDVIMTPTWTNIIDAVKPVSQIESVEVVNDSLSFNFISSDNRSGVWYHILYHRNDSTQMEWQMRKPQIIGNEFMLQPELLTTEYLVMAVDSAGNHEEKDMVAEYIYYYDGPSATTQANALAQGWNWWSTYIEQNGINGMEMLQNSLGHNGLTIKSQNDFTDNFYQDMGYDYWYGSLESIANEQGYLINVTENGNASLTGMVANPANHPITIQPNWNWIGYSVAAPQAVTSALAGFNPMADDVVKGQSDFTSYYEGFGWYPDDFMLIPGQSYLYFSNANANKTLTYSGGGRGGVLKTGKTEKPFWRNDVHAFADNINVMAVVSIDNEEQRDENLELGAFVNGECRGSARLSHFAPQDRYIALLTVSGQEGELVEFRLVHTESHEMNEVCANHLVFSKNAIVGSLGKPYEIRFGDDVEVTGNMTIYPNPVESGKTFSLNVPQGETITEVIISDVLGNQLRYETGAMNSKAIKGLPAVGVYVIKAVAKSGNTYYGRLIVE